MNFKNYYLPLCAALAFGGALASCSDDDGPEWNDEGSKLELPANRMFLLNEGNWGSNNASLSLIDPVNHKVTDNLFYKQNGMRLGDLAQDIIEYDDNIYIAVSGSNYLTRLNTAGVEEARVSFADDPELTGGVRYLAAEDGFIYASFYGGVVAKINAGTLEIESKLTELGKSLEGVAIENDCLYVANSCTPGSTYVYHEEVFVIDLRTFTLKETLKVASNPYYMTEEDDKIFLVSWGNYADKGYEFQMIDPAQGNKVTSYGPATRMAAGNDKVYVVYSEVDWSTYPDVAYVNTFKYFDIKAGKMVDKSFVNDPDNKLGGANVYMLAVDDNTGDIYVGVSNSTAANGVLYCVGRDGNIKYEYEDCGGQNPNRAVFLRR